MSQYHISKEQLSLMKMYLQIFTRNSRLSKEKFNQKQPRTLRFNQTNQLKRKLSLLEEKRLQLEPERERK